MPEASRGDCAERPRFLVFDRAAGLVRLLVQQAGRLSDRAEHGARIAAMFLVIVVLSKARSWCGCVARVIDLVSIWLAPKSQLTERVDSIRESGLTSFGCLLIPALTGHL